MAVLKLSQITFGGGVNTSTDSVVAVRNGTTDVRVSLASLNTPPGGAHFDVQINDGAGGFYGDSNFTYDGAGTVTTQGYVGSYNINITGSPTEFVYQGDSSSSVATGIKLTNTLNFPNPYTLLAVLSGGDGIIQIAGGNKLRISFGGTDNADGIVEFNQLLLRGNTSGFDVGIAPADSTAAYNLTLPAAQGGSGKTLINNGSGVLSWGAPSATVNIGSTIGGGTNNTVLFVDGSGNLADSSSLTWNDSTGSLSVTTNSASHTPLTVIGNVSQTADLQGWQSLGGTVSKLDYFGRMYATDGGDGTYFCIADSTSFGSSSGVGRVTSTAGFILRTGGATWQTYDYGNNGNPVSLVNNYYTGKPAFRIVLASGQTADALEVLDNSNNPLAIIDASGNMDAVSYSVGGSPISATNITYTPNVAGNWAGTAPNLVQSGLDRLAQWIADNGTVFTALGITTQP